MNTLIVTGSLTIVNLLNKVQFPFVKVFPPQMLSSSSEGAIVQAVPIAFAPVTLIGQLGTAHICDWLIKVKQIYEPSCLLFHGLYNLLSQILH